MISAYTLESWGRAQLLQYVGGLLDAVDKISENPGIGRRTPGIPARFLRHSYGSHFIFFSKYGENLHIIRILHQRMDHAAQLG